MKTAVVMISVCLSALISEAQPSDGRVSNGELGQREWPAASNGLVFVEGEFLPPPYVVSRIGSGIYINGRHIESPLPWHTQNMQEARPDVFLTDPVVPETITEKTTQYDKDFIRYIHEKRRYLFHEYGQEEGMNLMVDAYKSLPCIVSATRDAESPNTISVKWRSGRVSHIGQVPLMRKPVDITPEQAVKLLDGVCEIYAEGLKATNYFMFGSAKRRGTQESFARTLEPLANALRSAKDEADFLSVMKTNQPPGGMSEKALRSFYKHRDEVSEWERRLRGCDDK